MTTPRKPAAFRVEPDAPPAPPKERPAPARRPRAIERDAAIVVPAEIDVFAEPDAAIADPPPALPPRRRSRLGALFFGALGILVSLAVGLWVDALVRELFARSDWLGWFAAGVAALAVVTLVVLVARELVGLARLRSVEHLRSRAREVLASNDTGAARSLVAELSTFVAARPETAAGRRALRELEGEIIDGADLLRLAERELLTPLDERAVALTLEAAKRVSVVTAVSPRALVDIAYVVFEAGRLIRRMAELYGGRPGTLGFITLARRVIAHLAVTGAIAAGDDFVHQVVGQGLAARLSAKLGEGVVNGMMTARIGVAAMETARPLPFTALKRPGMGDFLASLTTFLRRKQQQGDGASV
jgi:putative membrane protein